jgi:hypothetical protein
VELEKIAESFVLGTLYVETIPSWATDALLAGYDSPSLRQLAGTDVVDHQEIRDLFQDSLRELGVSLPSPSEAGLSKAKEIADEIVRGVVTHMSVLERYGPRYTLVSPIYGNCALLWATLATMKMMKSTGKNTRS